MFNHLLTVFVCAADCGSFNKAAEKLYLSAPSVMKQVNALEKQLDMKLFHRTNQGLHLTPAGQVIYRHAKYLFSYSRNAIAEARSLPAFLKKRFVSDKNIKVNYQGERPYSTTMTPADRQAVASVYELAQLLSSITEIKKEMEEANLKIEFVKRKMQEREEKETEQGK